MAEASMISIFNGKVSAFNNALKNDDSEQVCAIGIDMLHIALDECAKANVSTTIKDTYKRQAMTACTHIANMARKPRHSLQSPSDVEGENDPYYVKKEWFSSEVPPLNFTNIIGVQEVKDAFMVDVVAPLRPEFKEIYKKFRGDQMGSQILLYGPPGTGKTHIVKCLAGALNCKIAVVQTSEVLASIVGVAEKNIRDVFEQAGELDRCIIFLDEIDSICSDRNSDDSRHTKSILTTMLTCMDGFLKTKKDGQLRIIVAATNLPWKLDSALKRGGRFETQIYVPLPDEKAREKFIELDLSKLPHSTEVTIKGLAKMLEGYSGADIKAIMKQIANEPLRREVKNILNPEIKCALGEVITLKDCENVIKNYINVVTPEMLLHFEAYDKGISYEELVKVLKSKND
ncbi:MAG: ATP-binding protein [Roseburia sp.]|nr:ATP-binding protein [Anaeroplasma bactoclasticum]MCM1196775.1 ATP-binding protein [Roseburia sp.]MCM1556106.1 ATP-binding protein [Anaeroplasma bactoclasticum]